MKIEQHELKHVENVLSYINASNAPEGLTTQQLLGFAESIQVLYMEFKRHREMKKDTPKKNRSKKK